MPDTVFGFNSDDANRITSLIDKTAHTVRKTNHADPPYGPTQFLAYTTSTITARSGTTVGSGTAQVYRLDGTTLTAHLDSDTDIYNILTVEVDIGEYIMIGKEYASGKWIVHLAGCD